MISIKEIMKKDFSKLAPSDSVESAVELIEKRDVDQVVNLHNEEQMDEYKKGMNQIKTQGGWVGEIGHIRKDGTPFPTYMSFTLLRGADGKPTGILAAVRDITDRKQA